MKIINNVFSNEIDIKNSYVAIGSFDGIHYGHRKVIKQAVKRAKEENGVSLVFTFANHPLEVTKRKTTPKLINSLEEKIHVLEDLGVDYVVFQEFNEEFSNTTPLNFVEDVLKRKLDVREVFVGFNFSFGKGGAAKAKDLVVLGNAVNIKINITEAIKKNDQVISSTLIRKLITEGKLKEVEEFLGYPYFIIGDVIHGKKLGRKMGFPTANLKILNKIYPPFGIYGATVRIEGETKERDAVVNIGKNPTLKPGEQSIEVHILDFNEYIYGKKIYLHLVKYLRKEKKFSSLEELKEVINRDVIEWRQHLKKEENNGKS